MAGNNDQTEKLLTCVNTGAATPSPTTRRLITAPWSGYCRHLRVGDEQTRINGTGGRGGGGYGGTKPIRTEAPVDAVFVARASSPLQVPGVRGPGARDNRSTKTYIHLVTECVP